MFGKLSNQLISSGQQSEIAAFTTRKLIMNTLENKQIHEYWIEDTKHDTNSFTKSQINTSIQKVVAVCLRNGTELKESLAREISRFELNEELYKSI